MTEDEARGWIAGRFGAAATDRVGAFLDMVVTENAAQNLVAPGTIAAMWTRHALDSAQLLTLAPDRWDRWLDIGTGGGFPGMVIALLAPERRVLMAEPRGRRAEFLSICAERLALGNADVAASKVENVEMQADVISARAVAGVENLLRAAAHCATDHTTWLLPRGRSGATEPIRRRAMFHVEHSLTDPQSIILLGRGRPKP